MSLQLLERISKGLVDLGADIKKVETDAKTFIEETKANEIINPTNTGAGKEVTRLTETNDDILEMIQTHSEFLSLLP